jgi:hypothetical protein
MDRSPLRRAMDDNRNNHREETEIGLRLMRQPLPTLNADSCSVRTTHRRFRGLQMFKWEQRRSDGLRTVRYLTAVARVPVPHELRDRRVEGGTNVCG